MHRANSDDAVSGAQVTVTDVTGAPIFSGETDANGQITFEGCGIPGSMAVIIYASKPGYEAEERRLDLIACCEEAPPAGGGPQFECTTNANCEGAEYCAMLATAAGGNCEPVVVGECGYAANHAWVAYECGSEAGCPSCSAGFDCSAHVCAAT
ncbi:carboxypeptidase regulatory-like domain-containing protein, partial [Candidatus Micrarchaeota archaeon]|nr:carboxypeptidase regulatory-like domain-containing protein [Candidatus Micrarchaeota archaeon]